MVFEDQGAKRKKYLTGGAAALILLFILAFGKEILDILRISLARLETILGIPYEMPPGVSDLSVLICLYNAFFGFFLVFLVWLLIVSHQALFPVHTFPQIQRAAWALLMFILRMHGPAIFVRGGKALLDSEDELREGPGVIVIDFNSAVVLEERVGSMWLTKPGSQMIQEIGETLGLSDRRRTHPRACGPGVVFTRPRERIRGVVDLRKQFRIVRGLPCYTRDGIELKANVLAGFTVGQQADILWVTYDGERRWENLKVVTLDEAPNGDLKITSVSDELDEPDKKEIHYFARWQLQEERRGRPTWLPYSKNPPVSTKPEYNPDRVFAAVFAQARTSNQELLSWSDLPTQVASEFYREILSQVNYDELYDVQPSGKLTLLQYKRRLRMTMRNNGILAFRLILYKEGDLQKGRTYSQADLLTSDSRELKNSKMLRDRGIKINISSFGDPSPVSPEIYLRRLDTWRAKWQSDLEINSARRELNAMRIRSRAYAATQKDIIETMVRILDQGDCTEEAMYLRIMQALDNITADPKTRQLLPHDVMDLVRFAYSFVRPTGAQPGFQLPGTQQPRQP